MQNGRPDKLVMSFHGVRASPWTKRPYHCVPETGLLAEALETETGPYRSASIALRPCRMAQTLHHGDPGKLGKQASAG